MTLKWPPEKSWNWCKPSSDVVPTTPGASGMFLAPSGMGKTTTIVALLLGPYRECFTEIHVCSPSVEIDSAWDPVREFAKTLEASSFNSEWDEVALREILDRQRTTIRDLKLTKTKKPLPQILILIDDFADRGDLLHRTAGGILTTLCIRGRHLGISCWVSSQKLTAISTVARVNFRFMCVWRLRNRKELGSLLEELSALHPVPTLHRMYETAINDEEHSFWYINLVSKKKEDMFFIRFEFQLLVDD